MPSLEPIWTTVLWCGSIETKLTLLDLKRYRKGQSGWSSMIKCQPILIYSGGQEFPQFWSDSSEYWLPKSIKLSMVYLHYIYTKKLPYNLRAGKIIIQQKCNTTTHDLNSLTYQGAKLWNSLPEHIKTAESVNKFQILIEKCYKKSEIIAPIVVG